MTEEKQHNIKEYDTFLRTTSDPSQVYLHQTHYIVIVSVGYSHFRCITKTYPCNIQTFFFSTVKIENSLWDIFFFFYFLLKTLIAGHVRTYPQSMF